MDSVAVKFVNASKKYNSDFVLNNLQMTVRSGIIYGVLGASGCGKTTMLSCILGTIHLDHGHVYVNPEKTIGYMPQEIGLYETFTVSEVLQYFGKINGMSDTEIVKSMKPLLSILKLTEPNKRIDSMSGGQKRRTSLAVLLLNHPSILILDEPTVGLDPLIRQNIWSYLQQLVVEKGTTIIITTHYVEEAKDCNMISFMSNGRLLVEKPPMKLLKEYNTNFLGDVFLQLCKWNLDSQCDDNNNLESIKCYSSQEIFDKSGKSSFNLNMHDILNHLNLIWILIERNCLLIWRIPLSLFIMFAIPLFQVLLTNLIFSGNPSKIPFGILNEELNGGFCESSFFNGSSLSCKFLDSLPPDLLQLNYFSSEGDALDCVISGSCLGYLKIPSNFTNDMMERIAFGKFSTIEALDGSLISAKMDNSEYLKTVFIKMELVELYLEFIRETLLNLGGEPRMAEIPIKLNTVFHEGSYIEFMQYPMVLLIIFLTPMTASWIYIYDKKSGILNRTNIAGVNFLHLLASHFIVELSMMSFQISMTMGIQILFFNLQIHGSIPLLFALTLTLGICAFSFGMLFGVIWDTEIEVVYVVLFVYFPTMIASGLSWGRESVGPVAKLIYNLLPAAFPIEASRAIVSRGFGLTHSTVWPGFAMPIMWILINCIIFIIFKRKGN